MIHCFVSGDGEARSCCLQQRFPLQEIPIVANRYSSLGGTLQSLRNPGCDRLGRRCRVGKVSPRHLRFPISPLRRENASAPSRPDRCHEKVRIGQCSRRPNHRPHPLPCSARKCRTGCFRYYLCDGAWFGSRSKKGRVPHRTWPFRAGCWRNPSYGGLGVWLSRRWG